MNENAERINGWAAMLGVIAAMGAYAVTGDLIPGIWQSKYLCDYRTVMRRYALEFNFNGKWIRLVHYTNLSKQKADFYMYLCKTMCESHATITKELRCVSL